MEKKVGIVRERLRGAGLRVLNVSLIGSKCIEVLVDGLDPKDWKTGARSAGFGVLDDFDPTNLEGKAKPNKTSFVQRVNHEIKTSRRTRVKEFYREWLQLLGWAADISTPPIDP